MLFPHNNKGHPPTMRHLFFILLGLAMFMNISAFAAESIGYISLIKGEVLRQPVESDTAIPSNLNDTVFEGDTIQTGAKGRAQITLNDGTTVTVGRKSKLVLEGYNDAIGEEKLTLGMPEGWFKYASGEIAKRTPQNVKINSMFATIGIRGTEMWTGMMPDQECAVYVENGAVSVANAHGEVVVGHGEGTRLRDAESAPQEVKVWGEKAINILKREVVWE